MIQRFSAALILVVVSTTIVAGETKVHNIEYPSRLYGEGGVIVTAESDNKEVECIAYKDNVPVGSGSGFTKTRIANVTILISSRAGALTVRCR